MTGPATLVATAEAVRTGTVSAVELVRHAQAAADRWDPALGIFDARFDESALAAAEAADMARARGSLRGPLHGVPIAVKDNIATVEAPCRAGSVITGGGWLSGDAPAVARLRAAGAIVPSPYRSDSPTDCRSACTSQDAGSPRRPCCGPPTPSSARLTGTAGAQPRLLV